jgi:hypothetical protein
MITEDKQVKIMFANLAVRIEVAKRLIIKTSRR